MCGGGGGVKDKKRRKERQWRGEGRDKWGWKETFYFGLDSARLRWTFRNGFRGRCGVFRGCFGGMCSVGCRGVCSDDASLSCPLESNLRFIFSD